MSNTFKEKNFGKLRRLDDFDGLVKLYGKKLFSDFECRPSDKLSEDGNIPRFCYSKDRQGRKFIRSKDRLLSKKVLRKHVESVGDDWICDDDVYIQSDFVEVFD